MTTNQPFSQQTAWIFEQSGPILRFRCARDLLPEQTNPDRERLLAEMLASPEVQRWLQNLGRGPVHHSKDTAADNTMAKAAEFGLRAGIPDLDQRVLEYCDLTGKYRKDALVLAGFLIRLGYHRQSAVAEYFTQRVEALYNQALLMDFNLYMDESELVALPPGLRGKPIYRTTFNTRWECLLLPTCYDFIALAYGYAAFPELQKKIDAICRYLVHPSFQTTPGGYAWDPQLRRHYAAGRVFLAMLPGFAGALQPRDVEINRLVLFLETAAHLPVIRQTTWFKEKLAHLDGFCTPRGTWIFPKEYLLERPNSYYLYAGAHMGLGEDRRQKIALELESTFRMLFLKKISGI